MFKASHTPELNIYQQTTSLLKAGLGLNEVCKVVAEYQRCYILLKNNKIPEDILKTFTTEMWWKSRDCR